MRLLMILVDSNHQEDVERILDAHDVPGYTEVPNVLGKGVSGRKFGSRAFPGSNTLYFTAVDGNICQTLCAELKALDERSGPDEGLSAFMLDADKVV
ncbi:MAG: hypothetical protein HKO65_07940 [Gemmatimonadetes bacterium]|nr:hypothetical protein [Gemmatimonadota bacterium]NNM05021.1 hypothetical protein [Gemmatimonadota bacterium]